MKMSVDLKQVALDASGELVSVEHKDDHQVCTCCGQYKPMEEFKDEDGDYIYVCKTCVGEEYSTEDFWKKFNQVNEKLNSKKAGAIAKENNGEFVFSKNGLTVAELKEKLSKLDDDAIVNIVGFDEYGNEEIGNLKGDFEERKYNGKAFYVLNQHSDWEYL